MIATFLMIIYSYLYSAYLLLIDFACLSGVGNLLKLIYSHIEIELFQKNGKNLVIRRNWNILGKIHSAGNICREP